MSFLAFYSFLGICSILKVWRKFSKKKFQQKVPCSFEFLKAVFRNDFLCFVTSSSVTITNNETWQIEQNEKKIITLISKSSTLSVVGVWPSPPPKTALNRVGPYFTPSWKIVAKRLPESCRGWKQSCFSVDKSHKHAISSTAMY